MAGSPGSSVGLIGTAWADRLAVLRWITSEIVAACADAAELRVADSALGDLSQQLVDNKADKSAPLVQAVYYLESEYLETFLLTLQNA